ncbi:hypothetical protein M406DRAFT_73993 [Cryphonectria parasitica EP155]|uniref:Uncharacterized protein n=1 Tax=Cryphonectria parasitica (strain ATCC 38755 / EP155) TaxID=660469 RepID=A0A9P4XZ08_CRYP1|nr:uncharacterized protein M406DRAFT_73993 [Cryphonectria parasitica EP155]KAF3763377.1 hypothetical protein M406DRAFT_73993 [Cryphonectria parasitica EP155]
MPGPAVTTRLRSRSSVDHIFDLVENLEEDQLQDLLLQINSTGDNIQVAKGVELFEEEQKRRRQLDAKTLRPTPSFLDQPHEPLDWPRQKPRPVSGSQWRGNMRIVSTPYTNVKRHQTEPISPPLTASPPASPPLSPPGNALAYSSPRRSVTAPLLKTEVARVEVHPIVTLDSPVSPPRSTEADDDDDDDDDDASHYEEEEETMRPAPSEFASFSFGLDHSAVEIQQEEEQRQDHPVSPRHAAAAVPSSQPRDFSRINTTPLASFHHQPKSLDAFHDLPRPNTSIGTDAAAASSFFRPRAFRRISRPTFLSPVNVSAPDELAQKLSAYLKGEIPSPPPAASQARQQQQQQVAMSRPGETVSPLEEMLKEPLTPRSRFVFGRVEREVPNVSGIFEVLTEG